MKPNRILLSLVCAAVIPLAACGSSGSHDSLLGDVQAVTETGMYVNMLAFEFAREVLVATDGIPPTSVGKTDPELSIASAYSDGMTAIFAGCDGATVGDPAAGDFGYMVTVDIPSTGCPDTVFEDHYGQFWAEFDSDSTYMYIDTAATDYDSGDPTGMWPVDPLQDLQLTPWTQMSYAVAAPGTVDLFLDFQALDDSGSGILVGENDVEVTRDGGCVEINGTNLILLVDGLMPVAGFEVDQTFDSLTLCGATICPTGDVTLTSSGIQDSNGKGAFTLAYHFDGSDTATCDFEYQDKPASCADVQLDCTPAP